jgi:hypothetical protein
MCARACASVRLRACTTRLGQTDRYVVRVREWLDVSTLGCELRSCVLRLKQQLDRIFCPPKQKPPTDFQNG